MVEMHEMVPGKRFDRYHELGQQAFGEKLGLWRFNERLYLPLAELLLTNQEE
jgi:hypothetical protein